MDAAVAPIARTARLFSPLQVGVTAALGGPIAATATLAANFRELGDARRARQTLLLGPILALALIGLGALLPPGAITGASIGLAYGAYQLARRLDRPAVPRQPLWLAILIAVVAGVATVVLGALLRNW